MSQWMRYHELSRSERKARERDSKMQAGFRGVTGRQRGLGGTSSRTLKSDLTKKAGVRDNKLQAENELLRELLREERESGQLREDNERLRRLLKKCQPYIEAGISECDTQLCDEVEKEVGDE